MDKDMVDGGVVDSDWEEEDVDQVYVSVSERFVMLPLLVHYDPRIKSQQKELYQELRICAFQKKHCFPGEERLAKRLGCTSRTIRTNLSKLIEVGLVIRKRRLHKTNLYFLPSVHEVYVESLRPFKLMDWMVKSLHDRSIVSTSDEMRAIQSVVEDQKKSEVKVKSDAYKAKKKQQARAAKASQAILDVGEKAALAIKRSEKNKARKNKLSEKVEKRSVMDSEPVEKPLNTKDLQAVYETLWPSEARWRGKERGIAKNLMLVEGPERTIRCVVKILKNWDKFLKKYELKGPPAHARVGYWSKTSFPLLEDDEKSFDLEMMTPKERSLAQGEWRDDGSEKNDGKGSISFGFTD
jgi:hypothetical protein